MRIGLIGVGKWGTNILQTLSRLDVEVITCDKEKRTAQYLHYQSMPKVDACIIATPADTHYAIADYMLTKGVHCFIEKPMTKSKTEAQLLHIKASNRGLVLMVGHTFLYNPAVIAMKAEIDSGTLGEIYYINSRRLKTGLLRDDVDTLWNFAPHDISICNYLLSRLPEAVKCEGWDFKLKGRSDVAFLCLYYGTKRAHIHVSWLDPNRVREITVVGSKAMAICDDLLPMDKLKIIEGLEETVIEVVDEQPLYLELKHFIDCVKNKTTPLTDGLNGVQVVSILEAAQLSMKNNSEVIEL